MAGHSSYLRRGALTLGAVTVGGFLADYGLNLGLTRLLSVHDYGDFRVAYAFAFFCGTVVLLGGDRAAPMVLAPSIERGEKRRVWQYLRFYLLNAWGLAAVIAVVTWTLAWLHVHSTDPEHHHPLAWVVVAIPLNAFGAMVSRTLQSARRPAAAALPWRIALPVVQLLLFALWIWWRGALYVEAAVVLSIVAIALIAAVQGLWVWRLELVEVGRPEEAPGQRRWLARSLPMMGTFLVALALNQSDLYFLEILGDEKEVGHYAAAATAAHLLVLVQTMIIGLVAPLARPAIERGAESSRAIFRQAQRWMASLLVPVALLLALAAGPVLGLFGESYRDADTVLVLLVAGFFAWALAALPGLWLQYQGRAGIVLAISIAALGVDSLLNLLLIPRYGMDGAAAGTAFTLAAAGAATGAFLWRLSRRDRK